MKIINNLDWFIPEKCSEIIELDSCSCFLYENRYNIQYFSVDSIIDEEKAEAVMNATILLGKKQNLPILVYMKNVREITRGARKIFQIRGPQAGRAAALVASSTIGRMFANLFLYMNPTEIPVRLFNDPDSAIHWLDKLKD